MNTKKITSQVIRKAYSSNMEVAVKYYSLLSMLNDLSLTKKEIQLLAFTAISGTISSWGTKLKFIEQFHSSKGTIGNMIGKLSRKKLLVKINKKIIVNPQVAFDFTGDFQLKIELKHGEA